jgi:HPr kinase/phosphorylase
MSPVTPAAGELVYGSCVALGRFGALLRGPSGSGKSDLALRFVLETPPLLDAALVSDDQLLVERAQGRLIARPPATIAGKIEVRGLGIIELPFRAEAELRLLIRLCEPADVPRLPELSAESASLCGVSLPVLALAPFEASAPLKLRLALSRLIEGDGIA